MEERMGVELCVCGMTALADLNELYLLRTRQYGEERGEDLRVEYLCVQQQQVRV